MFLWKIDYAYLFSHTKIKPTFFISFYLLTYLVKPVAPLPHSFLAWYRKMNFVFEWPKPLLTSWGLIPHQHFSRCQISNQCYSQCYPMDLVHLSTENIIAECLLPFHANVAQKSRKRTINQVTLFLPI